MVSHAFYSLLLDVVSYLRLSVLLSYELLYSSSGDSGGGGYMTAPAPLVAGRWEGVCQDVGTGDWRAGNDHGHRCDCLNSQQHSPERD